MSTSFAAGHAPEALITAAEGPWEEIERVADSRGCESLLIGFGSGSDVDNVHGELETLLARVDCDVAILRSGPDWRLEETRRILVPVGGRGEAHNLRARFLGSLSRSASREITFVTVVPPRAKASTLADTLKNVSGLAEVRVPGAPRVHTLRDENVANAIISEAEGHDLVVLGLRSPGWRRQILSNVVLRIAREAPCPTVLLSRGERWRVSKPFG
jgi:nucleotide-binding universal stress UspA family protein